MRESIEGLVQGRIEAGVPGGTLPVATTVTRPVGRLAGRQAVESCLLGVYGSMLIRVCRTMLAQCG
jgi:hypothetical protein